LKALSLGAKAVGVGRFYLFPLAAGQAGVERALGLMRTELERDIEADGLHVHQPAVTREPTVQVRRGQLSLLELQESSAACSPQRRTRY
jgi:hypothetical protein